jgi:hypothetical protein
MTVFVSETLSTKSNMSPCLKDSDFKTICSSEIENEFLRQLMQVLYKRPGNWSMCSFKTKVYTISIHSCLRAKKCYRRQAMFLRARNSIHVQL